MAIQYSDAVDVLLERVPEFRPTYEERPGWLGDDYLPHLDMGSFTRFVVELLRSEPTHAALLDRIFILLEEMSNSDDARTQNLVQVSFLENLGKVPEALERARQLMRSRTRLLSDEIEAFWDKGIMPATWLLPPAEPS
jgi:hypothetical protein